MVTSMARFGEFERAWERFILAEREALLWVFRERNLSPRYINSRSSLVVLEIVGSQDGYAAGAWSRILVMGADDSPRGIAAERWEELRKFRVTRRPKHITVKGVSWDYIAGGEGGEGLLLLPGGAMVGEAGFTRIPAFEDRYRVIAPDYTYVSTAALLLDGLAGVLGAEEMRVTHVLGPSYDGLVAQCFVRRHPERVRSLILTNTLVPPQRLLWPARIFLTLLPLVPVGWLRALS